MPHAFSPRLTSRCLTHVLHCGTSRGSIHINPLHVQRRTNVSAVGPALIRHSANISGPSDKRYLLKNDGRSRRNTACVMAISVQLTLCIVVVVKTDQTKLECEKRKDPNIW